MSEPQDIRLPDPAKLVISSSPHVHAPQDVRRIMLIVILTLLPACAAGVYYFGMPALWVLGVSTVSCVVFEALFSRMLGKPSTVGDLSAVLTGVLLGMNLSAATPWWVCVIGALLAMGLGKHIYGGLGYNPFNPALVARVGLLIAFPGYLTTWVPPDGGQWAARLANGASMDAVTTATPLYAIPAALEAGGSADYSYLDYFLGSIGGCIGETSAAALLLGGIVLIALRLIRWEVPLAFMGTVLVITGLVYATAPGAQPTPLFHILTGGLFLGAFYMATDMVTSPMTKTGALVFGVGCGLVTCVIRIWGSYPEGVSFSILFMNALVPLIDRYTRRRPFGARRSHSNTKATA